MEGKKLQADIGGSRDRDNILTKHISWIKIIDNSKKIFMAMKGISTWESSRREDIIWCEISAVHHMEPVLEPLYESAACQPALTANEESCERVAVN